MAITRERLIFNFVSRDMLLKSRKEYPQKLTQLSPRSHPRHLVGKKDSTKDAIKDITSNSQVNSYFPYRWSPASLTIYIYFYLFLYLYITRIMIKNGKPHLKSLKSQKQKSRPGTVSNKIARGLQLVCGRPTLYIGFRFVKAAVVCAIRDRTSGFELLFEKIAQRYLKLVTAPSLCRVTLISL